MGANRGAAQPARGTARLGAEDHSVLVADGEGAARLRGGAGARRAPPLTALPPPLCRILGEAPRGGERRLQPEPPGEGARSQEGGKGAERGGRGAAEGNGARADGGWGGNGREERGAGRSRRGRGRPVRGGGGAAGGGSVRSVRCGAEVMSG